MFGNYILIENQEYWVNGEPLNSFWERLPNRPSIIGFSSSPLDKGYYAKWQLLSNKLYLLDFYSENNFLSRKAYSFESFFGKKDEAYFAEWFSGTLKVQYGKTIYYNHHFGSTKEYVFNLIFHKGILVDSKMEDISL